MEKERADRPELRLRGEARSVWLDTLTADQQRAFEKLIRLIDAARLDLPSPDEWSNDPKFDRGLDERSTSRVILLGGGRGSGKTTVASTLQKALSGSDDALYDKERELTAAQKRLELIVDELRPNVIVLEPLSMEDTPSETNILAALLARIEQLLFPKLTHEDAPSTSSDQRQHSAVLELLRLQTDVAIAWNGNLGERKGQLDPDNYAMEELRVERVRLQLRDRFATVLRRTARDSLSHKNPALFLLIVDDADVNPAKLMDLLERLRMVAVVEFVILLVGDIRAIEAAFRLHFANRFRLDERRQVEPEEIGMDPKEMSSLTNSIGRSALRKHVPYHQRVLLQPLKARETVGLSPLRRTSRPLAEMLRSVSVSYPAVPHRSYSQEETARLSSLESAAERAGQEELTPEQDEELELLRAKAAHRMTLNMFVYPEAEIDQDSGEKSWYVGSRVLADSPRVAVDLWNTLRDAVSSEASDTGVKDVWADGGSIREGGAQSLDPRLHTLFRQLAAERLDAKTDLWHRKYSPIDDALRETIVRDGNLDVLDLVGTHHVNYVSDTSRFLEGDGERDGIYWSRHDGLQFEVMGEPASRREIGPLVLVEDLWSLENRTAAEQAAAERRRSDLVWVVSQDQAAGEKEEQRLKNEAAAANATDRTSTEQERSGEDNQNKKGADDQKRPKVQPPVRMGTPWPVPMYRTTRQVEQFGYMWNAFLSWWEGDQTESTDQRVRDLRVGELVDAWIACHTRSLLGAEPARYVLGEPSTETATPSSKTDADGVAETKELLLDLAAYLAGDDEWAATIACDWLASVGWLLERVGDSKLEGDRRLEAFLGKDFLHGHPDYRARINKKIAGLRTQAKPEDRDGKP